MIAISTKEERLRPDAMLGAELFPGLCEAAERVRAHREAMQMRRRRRQPQKGDLENLRDDWRRIGAGMRSALERIAHGND